MFSANGLNNSLFSQMVTTECCQRHPLLQVQQLPANWDDTPPRNRSLWKVLCLVVTATGRAITLCWNWSNHSWTNAEYISEWLRFNWNCSLMRLLDFKKTCASHVTHYFYVKGTWWPWPTCMRSSTSSFAETWFFHNLSNFTVRLLPFW